MEIVKDSQQLVAVMRRPEYGGPLCFVEAAKPGSVRRALSLKPQDMDWSLGRLGAVVVKLPAGGENGVRRGQQRRAGYVGQGSTLRGYGSAVSACPEIKVDASRLTDTARRLARYENLRHKAARGIHGALDLRLLLGGQQFYMLQQVLQQVVARLSAPDCGPREAERLQSKFSRLLLYKDQLLQDQAQGRKATAARRAELEEEIRRSERRTQVLDVKEALRQRRPVDPKALEEAARNALAIEEEERALAAEAAAAQKPRKTRR